MNQKGLKAIEVVGLTSYEDTDEYGHSDILVFIDGKLGVPGIQYAFDGSKLEFSERIRNCDIMIYSRTSGSYRIIPAVPGLSTSGIPAGTPIFTNKIVESQVEENEEALKEAQEEKKEAVKEAVDELKSWKSTSEDVKDMTVSFNDPEPVPLSEDEINDIAVSQLGETTEPKEE